MDNNTSGVIECAKEELEILELQHPNRFDYLKMDLKDFISDFQSSNNSSISTCPSVHTQGEILVQNAFINMQSCHLSFINGWFFCAIGEKQSPQTERRGRKAAVLPRMNRDAS